VTELAKHIQQNEPEIKGFSDKNIWRMKQFFETYKDVPKLSSLVREISWTHNMLIFSRCKKIVTKRTRPTNSCQLFRTKINKTIKTLDSVERK